MLQNNHGDAPSFITQIAKFMGPTWGPPGSCRPQIGPMLAPWTLISGKLQVSDLVWITSCREHNCRVERDIVLAAYYIPVHQWWLQWSLSRWWNVSHCFSAGVAFRWWRGTKFVTFSLIDEILSMPIKFWVNLIFMLLDLTVEAWRKWQPHCRQHFAVHFFKWIF